MVLGGWTFQPNLGNKIVERILQPERNFSNDSFGFSLNTANGKDNQQRIENERASCKASYPALFDEVVQLMKNAGA